MLTLPSLSSARLCSPLAPSAHGRRSLLALHRQQWAAHVTAAESTSTAASTSQPAAATQPAGRNARCLPDFFYSAGCLHIERDMACIGLFAFTLLRCANRSRATCFLKRGALEQFACAVQQQQQRPMQRKALGSPHTAALQRQCLAASRCAAFKTRALLLQLKALLG